jgi:hypothetical protein
MDCFYAYWLTLYVSNGSKTNSSVDSYFWPPQCIITMASPDRNYELIDFPLPCWIIYNLLWGITVESATSQALHQRPKHWGWFSRSSWWMTAPAVVPNVQGVRLHCGADGSPLATNPFLVNAVSTCHLTSQSLRLTACTTSFNIQKFCVLPKTHLYVLRGSQNKERLFLYTALT